MEDWAAFDPAQAQRAWPQTGAWQTPPQPMTRGTNNLMYRIETATGVYALRLASARVRPERLRFEHAVMTQLSAQGLPFRLPIAQRTAQGEVFAQFAANEVGAKDATAGGATLATLATLTPFIPGEHPQRADLAQAEAAGAALGLLDTALLRVALPDPAQAALAQDWRSAGDLSHCHPLVPDPRAAIAALPLASDETARLLADYDALMAHIPALYASLPSQLSHEDYDPGNVLMHGAQVTGVLDFEFCARDLRAMDLVVALTWWPVAQYGSGDEWPIIAALLRGYARHAALANAEIAAIPALFQFRAYTSLIHRLGRWRERLSPLEDVLWRARASVQRADWLATNGERLTQMVGEALDAVC